MTYKNLFISVIMMVIITIAAWTTLSDHSRETPASSLLVPDAYMENMTAIIMDKQGNPSMKLETPRMVHFPGNDVSRLTRPQLTIYRKSPQPWFITSQFADAKQGMDLVDFWEEVVIHHAADIESPSTIIKTPSLAVHPHAQTAETKATITLIQPHIVINATGMVANMNTGSIQLLSQARGEYVPD